MSNSIKVKPGAVIDCGEGMWNLRGSFKIKDLIEVGTQASLIALPGGGFIMLDAITPEGEARETVMRLTDGGKKVEAVLNLHPFHTLHCEAAQVLFPNAVFYGSERHRKRMPSVRWADDLVESAAVAEKFAEVLAFSLPRGVDYISADENVHFSSLLAFHRASRTVHSDDTLSFMRLPFPIRLFKPDTGVFFHPTLGKALEPDAGASARFRDWARGLAVEWRDAARLCAAHNGVELFPNGDFESQVLAALARVEGVLTKHEEQ